jgi:DmsE family decaheme c-type cytochrome
VLALALALPTLHPTSLPARAQEQYAGDRVCADCHAELVRSFDLSLHTTAPEWHSERICETCHGPAGAHAAGDAGAVAPLAELGPRKVSERCLACHRNREKFFSFEQSIHRLAEVGCTGCHAPHSNRPYLLERAGRALCAECHPSVAAQFDLPRSHPLGEGSEACAGCHEPHGSRAALTGAGPAADSCARCHFEKAGPYLYSHDVATVDGCAACHEVHGSPNRHLLRDETQVNLCYQCHSGSVTPGWHSAPRFLNEKCTACHSAIHGSNTNPKFLEE